MCAICILFSPTAIRRGLILDQVKGNIIKIDRHKYVRTAYHGTRCMSSAERKAAYTENFCSFSENHFVNIDTLFQLVDAILFERLVAFADAHPDTLRKSYAEIYDDIRACVGSCHVDGTIKDTVMRNPAKYMKYDASLVPMLQSFRNAGKKVYCDALLCDYV